MKQLFLILSVTISITIYSQNDAALFDNLVSDRTSIIPILFSYPDSIRQTILVASTYPQAFSRLDEIQKASSDSFQKLISAYSKNRQKQLWEITRYPGLITTLIDNKGKTKEELDEILKKYPESVKKHSLYFMKNEYPLLVNMENIHHSFEAQYHELTSGFPYKEKQAFNTLLRYPEIITGLSENIKTTITLGDLYKRNPEMVQRKTDSISNILAKENGIEYEDWKNGIQKDPALQKELKDVARKYSKENSNSNTYEDDIYVGSNDQQQNDQQQNNPQNAGNNLNVYPYPYWSGYPNWYGSNYWYPYPWWYQTGFYWPLWGSSMMFYGMPRYHFGAWYYNQPRNFYNRYPNTSNYFQNHYNGYRNYGSGFNRSGGGFYGPRGGGGGGGGGIRGGGGGGHGGGGRR